MPLHYVLRSHSPPTKEMLEAGVQGPGAGDGGMDHVVCLFGVDTNIGGKLRSETIIIINTRVLSIHSKKKLITASQQAPCRSAAFNNIK